MSENSAAPGLGPPSPIGVVVPRSGEVAVLPVAYERPTGVTSGPAGCDREPLLADDGRTERTERTEQMEHPERVRTERTERTERPDRTDRPERTGRTTRAAAP